MSTARVIRTEFVYPPIPYRDCDWRAAFDGYEPGDPLGYGRTEAEAVADLIDTSDAQGSFEIMRAA